MGCFEKSVQDPGQKDWLSLETRRHQLCPDITRLEGGALAWLRAGSNPGTHRRWGLLQVASISRTLQLSFTPTGEGGVPSPLPLHASFHGLLCL